MDFRRVIIDSRHRNDQLSESTARFTIDLPGAGVRLRKSTKVFIDEVSFSHNWGVIQQGLNDLLYVRERRPVTASDAFIQHNRLLTLSPGSYTAAELVQHLAAVLNNGTRLSGTYSCTLDDGRIQITNSTPEADGSAKLFSRREVRDLDNEYLLDYVDLTNVTDFRSAWTTVPAAGGSSDTLPTNFPADALEVIGLIQTPMQYVFAQGNVPQNVVSAGTSFFTEHVSLHPFSNLYICEVGGAFESSTLSTDGTTDILRRIPVTTVQGQIHADVLSTTLSYALVHHDTVISRLHFEIRGKNNTLIPLRGHHLVFSLVFQPPNE